MPPKKQKKSSLAKPISKPLAKKKGSVKSPLAILSKSISKPKKAKALVKSKTSSVKKSPIVKNSISSKKIITPKKKKNSLKKPPHSQKKFSIQNILEEKPVKKIEDPKEIEGDEEEERDRTPLIHSRAALRKKSTSNNSLKSRLDSLINNKKPINQEKSASSDRRSISKTTPATGVVVNSARPSLRPRPLVSNKAVIKVVGVGGGGGNAISRMYDDFPRNIEFVAINTDAQDLDHRKADKKVYIGKNITKGLGTGMNPELGRKAAEENRHEIAEVLAGSNLVFVTAGLGGGTGSGASAIVADIAKEVGALVIAVVTKPFIFEGGERARIADLALQKIKEKVDTYIVVSNDRIFDIVGKDTSIHKAFVEIDKILRGAVQGIAELIAMPGIINVDFADVRTIMEHSGSALVGMGLADGPTRGEKAVKNVLNFPLLDVSMFGAKGVLFGVSGGRDLKMTEIQEIARAITENIDSSAKVIFGAYQDRKLPPGTIKVTLIATGFEEYSGGKDVKHVEFRVGSHLAVTGRDSSEPRLEPKNILENPIEDRVSAASLSSADRNSSSRPFSIPEKELAEEEKKEESFFDSPPRPPSFSLKEKEIISSRPTPEKRAEDFFKNNVRAPFAAPPRSLELSSKEATKNTPSFGDENEPQEIIPEKEDQKNKLFDIWDIPAFLRKKKK